MSMSSDIDLKWMTQDPTGDESTLGQVHVMHGAFKWQAITWTNVD